MALRDVWKKALSHGGSAADDSVGAHLRGHITYFPSFWPPGFGADQSECFPSVFLNRSPADKYYDHLNICKNNKSIGLKPNAEISEANFQSCVMRVNQTKTKQFLELLFMERK